MSSKEQKKSEEKINEEILTEKCNEDNILESNVFTEHVIDAYNKEIENLKEQLAEAKNRERDSVLRVKAEMENLRRRTEQDIEKAHKFALEKFISELLPVIDSLDRALEVANESNFDQSAMSEGIDLTLKSMYDVIRKFGVEVISDVDVPLDPNIHQAIAMVESEDVVSGNILKIMQKGYTLNGRTVRAAIVTVAKTKCNNIEQS